MARVFPAFDYTLETIPSSTANANRNTDFLFRLPEPVTDHDLRGCSSLTSRDDGDIFLIRACGLRTCTSPTSGVGLSGLVPRPENAVLDLSLIHI